MDGARTLQYERREVFDIDYYRERPEDRDKPESERRWEVLKHPHIVIDVCKKLVLFVGTDTEALEKIQWCQQASPTEMAELRATVREHLADIGNPKETCAESSANTNHRWSGLRHEK